MVTIRRAAIEDVAVMYALQQRAFEEEGRRCGTREIPPLTEQASAIAAHVRTQLALVATDNETLVGCVRGVIEGGVCTVRALVVDPARQGAGLGSQLIRALEEQLTNVSRIDLTTNTIMEGNLPFYERHGYTVIERVTPAPGIQLVHMSKPIASDA